MTIRLLAKHGKYDANTNITLDAATEAGLIAAKLATTDLTGGATYKPPVIPSQRYSVEVEIDPVGNPVGLVAPGGGIFMERRPEHRKTNYLRKAPIPIDNMDAAVGASTRWVRFSGSSVLANDSTYALKSLGCSNAIRLTNLGTLERIQAKLPEPIVPSAGTTALWIYISELPTDYSTIPATERVCDVQLILSVDSGFATGTAASLLCTSSQFLHRGYNCLLFNTGDNGSLNSTTNPSWTYTGTGTAGSTYTHARLAFGKFQPAADSTPVIHVCGIFQGGESQPRVIINIDDAHEDTLDLANLFNGYGIPISIGVVTGSVGKDGFLTVDQLRELERRGNDIIPHSVSHPGSGGITNLTVARQIVEIYGARDWAREHGFQLGSDFYFFPQNAYNGRVLDMMAEAGYVYARGSKNAITPTVQGIDNPLTIGSSDLGLKTLAQINLRLDAAELYAATQLLYAHDIFSTPVQSATFSAGVVTVTANGHGYSNGHRAILRGADQDEYTCSGIVENATTNTFTFKVTGTFPAAAVAVNGNMRVYSPDFPAADAAAPTPSTVTYFSVFVALAKEINARRNAGRLGVDSLASWVENVRIAS